LSTDNIALNKQAWQRSQFIPGDDRFHASNAVDGLRSDLSALGGQCAISGDDQQIVTWRVDLGDILSIKDITIYYRTDNVPSSLFSLQIILTVLHVNLKIRATTYTRISS
jgi:hypothetical protein